MSIFSGDIASKRTETRANTKLKRYDPHRLRTTIILYIEVVKFEHEKINS